MAVAHEREMRGPLPRAAKPLPIFFSDRHGGWVAGPPDPPVVSIFLLGDVILRQEGFGWGVGDGGGGVGGGVVGCGRERDEGVEESGMLWSSTL